MQESRNNVENTLREKMKDATEQATVLEKKAKVRSRVDCRNGFFRGRPARFSDAPGAAQYLETEIVRAQRCVPRAYVRLRPQLTALICQLDPRHSARVGQQVVIADAGFSPAPSVQNTPSALLVATISSSRSNRLKHSSFDASTTSTIQRVMRHLCRPSRPRRARQGGAAPAA